MRISDWSSDVCSSDLRDRASPIIASDTHAYRRAITFIDAAFTEQRPPLHAQARGLIMQLLTSGDCTNQRIATELKLHARTVHRRLAVERSEEHTSELQSLMRIPYAVFRLKKKKTSEKKT